MADKLKPLSGRYIFVRAPCYSTSYSTGMSIIPGSDTFPDTFLPSSGLGAISHDDFLALSLPRTVSRSRSAEASVRSALLMMDVCNFRTFGGILPRG